MNLVLSLLFATPLVAIALHVNWMAQLVMLLIIVAMLGSGCFICRALGAGEDPFLGFVTGFVLLSHVLLAGDFMIAGAHWQIVVALGLVGLPALWGGGCLPWRPTAWLGLFAAAFTAVWCADTAARLAEFYATGKLSFWVDAFVHAGTIAQFGSPHSIGRGMILMADVPRPFYHYASYMPAALQVNLAGVSPLSATLLTWTPFGILIMACGAIALGLALGGPGLATMALVALALIPDPGRLGLGNGFLSFAWLLETAPGTPYSLGVACAALAALVRWFRHQSPRTLALAWGLTAGCMLVRANTFVWLAPAVVLGTVAGWQRLNVKLRLALVTAALISFCILLVILSWKSLRTDPVQFLFSYIEFALRSNPPSYADGLYPGLVAHLGRSAAGIIGLGLILLGTLGPWLPAVVIVTWLAHRRRQLEAADTLPFLLLLVAVIAMLLAPVARNGDISEFRHRAGPLLVIVIAIWTLRFSALVAAPALERLTNRGQRYILLGLTGLSLGILGATIHTLKQPRMAWGADLYGTRMAPELMTLAPLLASGTERRPRFAVADQSAKARLIDDASRLVALSGVPAYVSCPEYLLALGGFIGDEAERRLDVLARLALAPTLEALKAGMRTEEITYYVVTKPQDAPFDPDRRGAIGHQGTFAVYASDPG